MIVQPWFACKDMRIVFETLNPKPYYSCAFFFNVANPASLTHGCRCRATCTCARMHMHATEASRRGSAKWRMSLSWSEKLKTYSSTTVGVRVGFRVRLIVLALLHAMDAMRLNMGVWEQEGGRHTIKEAMQPTRVQRSSDRQWRRRRQIRRLLPPRPLIYVTPVPCQLLNDVFKSELAAFLFSCAHPSLNPSSVNVFLGFSLHRFLQLRCLCVDRKVSRSPPLWWIPCAWYSKGYWGQICLGWSPICAARLNPSFGR